MRPAPPPADRAGRFPLGPFPLACGETLPEAWLDYRVYGALNAERSNLVLYPSSYGAWPEDIAWAGRVVAAAEDARARGEGAVLLDGRMIDRPIEDRARRLMAL